jgi:fibronectin-binding autotransporter adhesin
MSLSSLTLISAPSATAAACTPETTTSGIYTVVAFKTVGSCTWSTPTGTNVFRGLIVAGGGGGGHDMGGGGGGGGYVEFESLTVTNDVLTIVVGNGGAGASSYVAGTSGGNSSISGSGINLVSRGGAGGATHYAGSYPAQSNGGSGGGAAGANMYTSYASEGTQTLQTQTPSLATINGAQFGFGGSVAGTTWYPGGGGGAGGAGTNTPATGGAGRANSILGTSYFWAGGGGGAGWTGKGGAGGTGGGGGGGSGNANAGVGGTAGTGGLNTGGNGVYVGGVGGANTGGGGGAGTHSAHAGAAGGSGIVVLRYLTFSTPTTFSSATTSPTKTTSPITFSVAFAQSVDSVANGDFSNAGTATGCSFAINAASGTSFTLTVSSCSEGTLIPQILAGSMRAVNSGANGPTANTLTTTPITIDRTAPTISSTLTGPSNATYIPGQSLTLTAPFSETVTVTGTPRLALTVGSTTRYANYASGSNTRTLTFTYVVQAALEDIDSDGITVDTTLDLNSGTILDLATNALSPLTFTVPTLSSVLVAQPAAAPTISSITPSNGALSVAFTAGAANGSAITNYQFSTNNGVNWSTRSPVSTTSPISITGLTNGQSYNVRLRAINGAGNGESTTAVAATPSAVVVTGDATLTTTYGQAASTGTYSATGGTGGYIYSLSETPTGVTIDSSNGTVTTATTTPAGIYTQNVRATDSSSQVGTRSLTITVNKASTTISIALPNSATSAALGGAVTITATVPRAGAVNFRLGGSTISGCGSASAASTTATCSWTPASLGSVSLTAIFTPTDASNFETSTSTALSITVVNGVSTVTLSLAGGTTTPPKGQAINIIAAVDQAGRVTFFVDGKRVPGCINRAASVGNINCSWKPAVQKAVTISARLTPTNNVYNASTSSMNVAVVRRSGVR